MKFFYPFIYSIAIFHLMTSCSGKNENLILENLVRSGFATQQGGKKLERRVSPKDIVIEKAFLYDNYTLEDVYPYKDTTRLFQWDKIKERLAYLQDIQRIHKKWGILQNYKNKNGESSLVGKWTRNEYNLVTDTFGIERYQSVALYLPEDTITGVRYGRDGNLVKILADDSLSYFMKIETLDFEGKWFVNRKYVKVVSDTVDFLHVIVVDRKNENITTLEKVGDKWLVRSMNPVTTGLHNPPYQHETPLGMFVIQEKKYKMFFLVDGTARTGGFAPYASRFTNGGYLHGIPVNTPGTTFIEYSASLGTTPRSHMCVRNATSHAKFIYDWAPTQATIVFVIE